MPTLPHIAPCTHNTLCLEYPCRLANPPAAFAAPIMASEDQPEAEANVAMSLLPEFSINTPTTWFQQAEARLAMARPALTSGQKYFQLLGKLPQDLMVNFTDIIAQCTIAAARNNGDPYTEMKNAILQFTTKRKWSCYFDLHTLSRKGTSGHHSSWPNSSALCQQMPPLIQTCSTLSFRSGCRSPSGRCWLPLTTPTPGPSPAPPTTSGTCGRPRRRLSPRPRPHETGPGPPTAATATADATTIAAHHPAAVSGRGHRSQGQTPHHNTQENDNGICWYHNKFQHKSYICVFPCNWQGNGGSSQ
jgi:hypothetical protein